MVRVMTHKMRDAIFSEQYQEPLEIGGKRIKIWKELPRDLIKQRREFKQIVDKLRQEQTRYRWKVPRGISFMYSNKFFLLKSQEQMQDFLWEAGKNQTNHNGN